MSVQRPSTVSTPWEGCPVGIKQDKVYVPEANISKTKACFSIGLMSLIRQSEHSYCFC